ncbi:phosphatidate cytidylyltransferase [Erythrobacter sp. WG]|uniref:phosphatidate cytidylyltransferase n=1 Tax=Erythrobacter sp. WG TaxID=2985510 RepID=UPI00226F8323|nr:phosphatidate cytidylyltransferase [Erythrobacter sp. WG]MCX9146466.1 phosphatidate cytidylyltransferase [Erythrobacter sp. WG]
MAVGNRVRDPKAGTSDLPVRFASAIVMLVLAGGALWLGGWFWTGFVALLALGVLWEWNRLIGAFGMKGLGETIWFFAGIVYVGGAALAMLTVRNGRQVLPLDPEVSGYGPLEVLVVFIAPIVAVDVGAYFAGRAIGGPKIAPRISPAKTWAGLGGGATFAALVGVLVELTDFGPAAAPGTSAVALGMAVVTGVLIAVIAQAGDFFESWMKRRAGVKDSGALIPGHGGLFDRLDGFIAVFFVLFVIATLPGLLG